MGGWNSGRSGGRPTVESGLTINFPLMMQRGWVKDGGNGFGSLQWSTNGEHRASIGYSYDMRDAGSAYLKLSYTRSPHGSEPEKVEQHIRLTCTSPNYGGRRWWLVCPYQHCRVAKLHLPPGGDRFASRKAWRLGYRSQRVAGRDRAFEKLFRLQRKLGCDEGWEAGLRRPKGMWDRTYQKHWERYWELDAQCSAEMMGVLSRLRGSLC